MTCPQYGLSVVTCTLIPCALEDFRKSKIPPNDPCGYQTLGALKLIPGVAILVGLVELAVKLIFCLFCAFICLPCIGASAGIAMASTANR